MNIVRPGVRFSILKALFCVLMVLSLSHRAHAHDPLNEDDGQSHWTDDATHHDTKETADLTAVRSLVLAFRETGDDQNLDAAWAVLTPALQESTIHPETLVVAAFVAQSRHEFQYAASLLDLALVANSRNDEAWLLKASVHLVQGDVRRAADACKQMHDVPALVRITCQARVALVSGEVHTTLVRLQRVLSLSDTQEVPPEILAWSLSVAGDLAVAGEDLHQARLLYERSLALAERTQVRAALVDVLLDQSEYEVALAAVPSNSTALPLLVRRLIATKKLKRFGEVADISAQVASEFEIWIAAKDWLHAREMARFYLDVVNRPLLARQLANINVRLQREPEDLRLLERTRAPSGGA